MIDQDSPHSSQLSNIKALSLYEKLGFMRVERLGRYYLNGGDAYRLKFFVVKPFPSRLADTDELDVNNGRVDVQDVSGV